MDQIILYYSVYLLIGLISLKPCIIGRTISRIDDKSELIYLYTGYIAKYLLNNFII